MTSRTGETSSSAEPQRFDRRTSCLAGALLGCAVGDAIGLPYEALSAPRARALFGDGPLRHRLLLGRGMISDDTEHSTMVAQALLAQPDDPARFGRSLAWRFRGWLLSAPAGVGFATARAILKLWIGFSPERSGVHSAGNGAAMRAPILGAAFVFATERLHLFVDASSRITHTDPRALEGARAVALAAAAGARHGSRVDAAGLIATLAEQCTGEDLRRAMRRAAEAVRLDQAPAQLLSALGLERGVSGFVVHTVPFALYCWARHRGDFRAAIETAVRAGGDTDTVAAIVGGLAGSTLGLEAIPAEWLRGLFEWPRSPRWMIELARRLAIQFPETGATLTRQRPVPLVWPALPLRNAFFLAVVLAHGFRRLLPPYRPRT